MCAEKRRDDDGVRVFVAGDKEQMETIMPNHWLNVWSGDREKDRKKVFCAPLSR
uniref:Uncharacterized protein n=1 Tax=Picea sitchensis TaxID=3332 RepID=D5AEE0_PICSI|nr:unknown [Picea sitchensis]